MNKVYEQLIYICKNMEKLEWIRKKVNLDLNFPIYKIDKELNKNIEKKMKERHEEKLVFLSERNEKPSKL